MVNPDFKDLIKDLEKRNQENESRRKELTDQQAIVKSLDLVQRAVVQSVGILIQALLEDTLKTQITNQKEFPKSFGTPDALAGAQTVKSAINELKQAVVGKDIDLSGVLTQLEGIHDVLGKLPTEYPSFPEMPTEMAVNNLDEMCDKLDAIGLELQNLKLDPKIEVKTPEIKIDLSKEIKQIEKAVKSISKEVKIPEQKETDLKPLVGAMKAVQTAIQNIQFPVPNFRTKDIVDAIENISIEPSEPIYKKLIDDTTTANVTYIGEAELGTATSASSWRIKRIDETSGVAITWSGTGFTAEWDERALTAVYT